MTEEPGSGQSPRRTGRPVDAEDPTSGLGSPSEPNATSSLSEIDAAITSLRAGEGDMAAPNPWLDRLELRSQNPLICPFLRAVEDDDRLLVPIEAPDALNRCAALHDPIPQSLRQQELVCLTSGHVNCPRYLRGALVAGEAPRRLTVVRPAFRQPSFSRPPVTKAILAALLVLVASFSASVAFVVARGGIGLSVAAVDRPSPSPATIAVAPVPEASPDPEPGADANADPDAGPHADSDANAHADTHANPDADADAGANGDGEAGRGSDPGPVPGAASLPEPLELLHLRGRAGQQPGQHRELLPGVV